MRSNCNDCCTRKCRKISSEYPKFRINHSLTIPEMQFDECPNYLPPAPFKMPMLVHLMIDGRKVAATTKILTEYDFRLKEQRTYPYFRLSLKPQGGVWQRKRW